MLNTTVSRDIAMYSPASLRGFEPTSIKEFIVYKPVRFQYNNLSLNPSRYFKTRPISLSCNAESI
jgi:hypothetical protein